MKSTAIRLGRALLWLIYAWVTVVIVMLFLAFILQLFGANPEAGFVEWVYRSVERSMAPFRGIFESVEFSDESTLDLSILFAMIVYGFVAMALHAGLDWVSRELRRAEHDEAQAERAAQYAAAAHPDRVVQLVPTAGSGATATARLVAQTWGSHVQVNVVGLDPSRSYEVWLEAAGGGRVAVGRFQTDANGAAGVSLESGASADESRSLGVSALPGSGGQPAEDVLYALLG